MKCSWLKDAIFYEIYPNSFKDSNDDGYGDFLGIISKLDYVKDLGVNAIWLNPHYDSPFMDGGYDVRDFFKCSSRFGTEEEFDKLVSECHKRNIHLIVDLVAGHTSEENEMFLKSASPKHNEYSDRFIWTKNPWDCPSEYKFLNGRYNRFGAYMVNFFSTQPALNYGFNKITHDWQMSYKDEEPRKTQEFLLSVMRFWLNRGVDGFRVDLADSLVKNDDNKEATIEIWKYMISTIKKDYLDIMFVSEWNNPYQSLEAGFDADFVLDRANNFYNDLSRIEEFNPKVKSFLEVDSVFDIREDLKKTIKMINDNKDKGFLSFITCNHDTIRSSYYLDEKELRLFNFVVLTLPGVPFIYYGDELGMKYQDDIDSVECGYARTGSRTPFPWSDNKNQGFSPLESTKPFLQVDYSTSLFKQEKDDKSLLNLTKKLIKLRNEDNNLKDNGIRYFETNDSRLLAYYRNNDLIIVNPTLNTKDIKLDCVSKIIFKDGTAEINNKIISIGGQSAVIVSIKNV